MSNARTLSRMVVGTEVKIASVDSDLSNKIIAIKGRLDSDDSKIQSLDTALASVSASSGMADSDLKVVGDLRNQLDSEMLFVRNLALSYTSYLYNATAGQTSFTGTDANSLTLAYTAGAIQVFLNGIRLEADDYTATDGAAVVLTEGAQLGHQVTIVVPKLASNYTPPLNWSAIALNTVLDGGGGNYGNKMDLAGDYAVVSAPSLSGTDYSGSVTSGGIFIYNRSDSEGGTGWPQQTLIYDGNLYPSANNSDYFGSSVRFTDENGDGILATNANTSNTNHKYNIYHFTRSGTTWSLAQTISPPTYSTVGNGGQMEAANNDHGFGRDGRLDTNGDYFIVGAATDNAGGTKKGSAWVYFYSSGSYAIQQELNGSDNQDNSRFGEQVSILGNTAVVGAPDQDKYDGWKGAVYIFTRSGTTWTQQQKIQPPTSGVHSPGKGMGKAISQSGDYIALGCHMTTVSTYTNAGKVLIYKWNGSSYVIDGSVTASDAGQNYYFGQGLDLRGNVLFVGSYGAAAGYIFTRSGTTWTQQKRVTSNPYETNASLGSTQQVKINKDTTKNEVLIGANGKGAWLFTL